MNLREAIAAGIEKPYWVETERAVKNRDRIIGYSVWHLEPEGNGGRTRVHKFSSARNGGWEAALYLANAMRDDLNRGTP